MAFEPQRRALQKLHEALSQLVANTTEAAKPVALDEPIGRLSRVDAMQQQRMVAANRQAARQRRRQVEAALARIDSGEYGECLGCGENIKSKRLAVQPEAALCLECQSQRERRD